MALQDVEAIGPHLNKMMMMMKRWINSIRDLLKCTDGGKGSKGIAVNQRDGIATEGAENN